MTTLAQPDTPPSVVSSLLEPFRHGFYGRRGGVSTDIYGSLNCGLGSNDVRAAVVENRRRVATSVGLPDAPILTCHQIHSAGVVVVDGPFAEGPLPKADGLVTRTPGILLGALAADCVPILFADARAGVVGAAHAGWKGALAGVGEATIAAMERLGGKRRDIRAVIGPCISQPNYEVGDEFRQTFVAADADNARFFRVPQGSARPHFDLPGYVLHRLTAAGITAASLELCTYANEADYYSFRRTTHRREPDYGRQVAVIAADKA